MYEVNWYISIVWGQCPFITQCPKATLKKRYRLHYCLWSIFCYFKIIKIINPRFHYNKKKGIIAWILLPYIMTLKLIRNAATCIFALIYCSAWNSSTSSNATPKYTVHIHLESGRCRSVTVLVNPVFCIWHHTLCPLLQYYTNTTIIIFCRYVYEWRKASQPE